MVRVWKYYTIYSDPEDSDIDEPYKRETPTNENVTLPIKVGDTLLMGRFKNKRVKIKTIGTNEKGDLLINGRSVLRFRMPDGGQMLLPKPPEISANPFDENTMLEFLTTIDMEKIISEITATTKALGTSGNWDTTSPTDYTSAATRAGKNFYVYLLKAGGVILSAASTYPSGSSATLSRKISGFHCLCLAAGTI